MEEGGERLYFGAKLTANANSPAGCLLGACSGWQPAGVFSLLTLLFSGALVLQTLGRWESFAKIIQSEIAGVFAAISSVKRGSFRKVLNSLSL
jgi:hypothetical protein